MKTSVDAIRLTLGARPLVWQRMFAVAAVSWALVLLAAPFAASRHDQTAALFTLEYGAYAIGRLVCHQIGARSFHLGSIPLPVCARCTGIYVGAALTTLAAVCLPPLAPAGEPARTALFRRVLLLAVLPTLATVVFEWTTGVTPSNIVRAAAGVPIGAAVAWIIREVN